MTTVSYTILPGTLRTAWNPVRLAISPEQEAEAWERARREGARMLAEFDKQDF